MCCGVLCCAVVWCAVLWCAVLWCAVLQGLAPVDTNSRTPQEVADLERKQKLRMLGNIRFIGELYKRDMLIEKIMRECVVHLLVWARIASHRIRAFFLSVTNCVCVVCVCMCVWCVCVVCVCGVCVWCVCGVCVWCVCVFSKGQRGQPCGGGPGSFVQAADYDWQEA